MQNDEPKSSSALAGNNLPAACRHIRCKEMYYQPPGQPADEFASGIHWCVRTQENFGPDGQSCSQCECGPERACYQN
ncbi:MAG: hypothetical protein QOF48_1385 [Verrucomicrobiota bacterium]|jgi:hypothetical protein